MIFLFSYTCSVLTGLPRISGGKNSLSFPNFSSRIWLEIWVYICGLSRISLHLSLCYLTLLGSGCAPSSLTYKLCRLQEWREKIRSQADLRGKVIRISNLKYKQDVNLSPNWDCRLFNVISRHFAYFYAENEAKDDQSWRLPKSIRETLV